MTLNSAHPLKASDTSQSLLLQALYGNLSDRFPPWFMRQAGRILPEYRKLRGGVSMLDSCLRPDKAAEVTLQPVRRHQVDAGIFFSDIVIPMKLAGMDVEIVPGVGPVFAEPITSRKLIRDLPRPSEVDFHSH